MDKERIEMAEKRLREYEAPVFRMLVFAEKDVLTASTDVGGEWPWTEE